MIEVNKGLLFFGLKIFGSTIIELMLLFRVFGRVTCHKEGIDQWVIKLRRSLHPILTLQMVINSKHYMDQI